MAEITLADGTIVKNVPEGTTAEQVQRKIDLFRSMDQPFSGASPKRPTVSGMQTFGRELTKSATDNLLGIPDMALNIGARVVNDAVRPITSFADKAAAAVTGQRPTSGFGPDLINTPPIGQDFVMPNSNEVFGIAQQIGERAAKFATGSDIPVATLNEARANQARITERGRQTNPFAAAFGDVLGDAAMLTSLKSSIPAIKWNPITKSLEGGSRSIAGARGLQQNSAANFQAMEQSTQQLRAFANAPDAQRAMNALFSNSKGTRALINQVGRAAEAGFEGSVIAMLNEGDPMELAAYSAGGQVVGSMGLSLISGIAGSGGLTSQGLRILGSAGGMAAFYQLAKTAIAGGDNSFLDSFEASFPKVLLSMALGSLGGMVGAGRVSSRFPVTAFPAIADGITTMQRGATMSVLNEMLKDPVVENVVLKLSKDPEFFGAEAGRRINRAMTTGDAGVRETIDILSNNKKFSDLVGAIMEKIN